MNPDGNSDDESDATPTTIPAAVMQSVAHRGAVEAVVDGEVRVTYAELGDRVIEATRAMMAAGITRGDRVAIWAPNGLGWIVAALGAHCAGAALVPINTRWKGAEAAYVLSAAKVSLLFTTVGFLGTDTVSMLDDDPTELSNLRSIVLLDGSAEPQDGASCVHWQEFVAAGESVTAEAAWERLRSVEPSDASDTLFTSGTTGRPKGVVMTHAQTVAQFTEWCDFAGLLPDDRYLIVNPFFHMFGYKAG